MGFVSLYVPGMPIYPEVLPSVTTIFYDVSSKVFYDGPIMRSNWDHELTPFRLGCVLYSICNSMVGTL